MFQSIYLLLYRISRLCQELEKKMINIELIGFVTVVGIVNSKFNVFLLLCFVVVVVVVVVAVVVVVVVVDDDVAVAVVVVVLFKPIVGIAT